MNMLAPLLSAIDTRSPQRGRSPENLRDARLLPHPQIPVKAPGLPRKPVDPDDARHPGVNMDRLPLRPDLTGQSKGPNLKRR